MRRTIVTIALVGTLAGLAASAAQARMFVEASNAPNYPRQMMIEDGDTLALKPGQQITVVLPDGTPRTLTSADNGPAARIVQPVKPTSWFGELVELLRSGGGSSGLGSMRTVVGQIKTVYAIDGVALPDQKIRLCVEPGAATVLVRDRTEVRQAVTILVGTGPKRATAAYEAGESALRWPESVAVANGQSYRIMPANAAPMEVEFRQLAKGLKGAERLRALGAAGCLRQVAAAVRAQAK